MVVEEDETRDLMGDKHLQTKARPAHNFLSELQHS